MKKNLPYAIYAAVSVVSFILYVSILPAFEINLSKNEMILFSILFSQPLAVVSYIFSKSNVQNDMFWDYYMIVKSEIESNPTGNYEQQIKKLESLSRSSSHKNAIKFLFYAK